jgi:hypothetical protein
MKAVKVFLAAFVLCIGLVLSPQSAFAEGTEGNSEYGTVLTKTGEDNVAVEATGTCGDSLNWTVYVSDGAEEGSEEYTLVISGTGAMTDYDASENAPWYEFLNIKENGNTCKLILEEGITHIGNYAFMPSSSTVDTTTFYVTQFVGSLTIPDTVVTIGEWAFSYNAFQGNLIIPDSVEEIGQWAFCSTQTRTMFADSAIVWGTGLKDIGTNAFAGWAYSGSPLSSTIYSLSNFSYSGDDNRYSQPQIGTVYTLSRHYDDAAETVTTRKVLPAGVLDGSVHSTFPNEKDEGEFKDVNVTWYLDASHTQPANITSFTSDTDVYADSGDKAGTYYASEDVASGTCGSEGDNLKWELVKIDDSNYTLIISGTGDMADYEAGKAPWYGYREEITKLVLKSGITGIGNYAFYGSSYGSTYNYEELEIPNTVKTIGDSAFENWKSKNLGNIFIIPEGVEKIGKNAFKSGVYNGIKLLIMPESLSEIDEYAFRFASTGTKIVIGSNAARAEENISILPYSYNERCYIFYYDFSNIVNIERGKESGTECNEQMLTVTKVCGSKTVTRYILKSDQLSDYTNAEYPMLEKYRTFPNELDEVNGNTLKWYSDEAMTQEIESGSSITSDITVYAACPGHEDKDKDSECDYCGENIADVQFKSLSLLLSGEIGVNFYVTLSDNVKTDDAYMEFSVSGKDGKVTKVSYSEDQKLSDGRYKFTCYVNAIQMADTITAAYFSGGEQKAVREYSVKEYIEKVVDASNMSETAINLVKSIADYGYYAQLLISAEKGWEIGTDHAEMVHYGTPDTSSDLSEFKYSKSGEVDGITKVTSSLNLDAETSIYLYLTVGSDYNKTPDVVVTDKDGAKIDVNVSKQSDGRYRLVIPNISAHKLGDTYTITVDGALVIKESALSYANAVLNSDATTKENKDAMAALHEYYQATLNYRQQ